MLGDSLEFPRRGDDWLVTVLIGGVLSLLGFLIIPAILVNGYLLRVVRAAVTDEETAPVFDDWGELFVDGILVWVIEFLYVGIPTVLLLFVVGSFTVIASVSTSAGAQPGPGAAIGGLIGLLIFLVLLLLVVVAGYLLPAAVANFARTGEFTAAFDLPTVARGALTVDYLVAILLVIVVSIVLGFVGALLSVILVGVFVLFYLQVVVFHLFGQGFARGLGEEPATG